MSPDTKTLSYPPLPSGVDAIRILTLAPGEFDDRLVCHLRAAAFSTKPRYVALSYTWGDPYPDSSYLNLPNPDAGSGDKSVPEPLPFEITVNHQPFRVHRNLYLCLRHLRSTTHPLPLWVDAVCINQQDMEERNGQVAMMSFIYSRAQKVVAWVGVREFNDRSSWARVMAAERRTGAAHHLAASLADGTKLLRSDPPDRGTLYRVARSAYWTRLWIVQEACLAYSLLIVFGAKLWPYEEMEKSATWKAVFSEFPRGGSVPGLREMLQLVEARSSKHTDDMKFERLVERFSKQACTDPKDRVYGLLGLANDVHASAGAAGSTDPVEEYIRALDLEHPNPPEPRRGVGRVVVDYDRSFYAIWKDAIKFVFFRARAMDSLWHPSRETDPVPQHLSAILDERRISVVRTAGIIQTAVGGKVGEELKLSRDARRLANLGGKLGEVDIPLLDVL